MGCTGSKQALRGSRRSPYARSCSGPVAHTVALKSSTLGSLSLDRGEEMMKWRDDAAVGSEAVKTPPSKQQARRQRQVRGSPAKTPAREPEVINVWELMDGLDDKEDEDAAGPDGQEERRAKLAPGSPEFDPDIIAAFRKALDEVSPLPDGLGDDKEDRVKKRDEEEAGVKKREIQKFPGIVRARVSAFQQRIDAKLAKLAPPPPQPQPPSALPPPDSARKVVLYLTSLRGIRKTYEDCWSARSILQGYGVRVDERDLSMHAGFKDELQDALGAAAGRLPQVFADGKHLGGAEEVRRMHEAGELAAALEACEMAPPGLPGKGVALEACSGCGGVRFVPCEECSGSCKVFLEEAGSFRRCPECNENGLVRCPLCSL
jgi:glutaredoxin domain-containing cysteine-rich protein 1